MRLRARKAPLSVRRNAARQQNEPVLTMTHKMYGAFIASLSAVTLIFAANETFARSGPAPHGGFTSTHSHLSVARSLRHHRRNDAGLFWSAVGGFYGPSIGEPTADGTQPPSGDIHYTQTYDVPWDWAHRYPPVATPSGRPYVPSCPTEAVTVTGRHGEEQSINITRCY